MTMKDIMTMFAALIILLVVAFGVQSYYTQKNMNEAKSEVFGNITNTTTNKEIVEYIHTACGNTPWCIWRVDCESGLLKTFITPTKSGY